MTQLEQPAVTASHPLQQLSGTEMTEACRILKQGADLGPTVRFSSVTLREPAKSTVRGYLPGGDIERQAKVVTYDRVDGSVHESVVSITQETVVSRVRIEGVQPPFMIEEYLAVTEKLKTDPQFVAALSRRGVTDLENIQIDAWPPGNFGSELDESGRRMARAVMFNRHANDDNGYAYPIENLVMLVDYDTTEIVEIFDGDPVPLPPESGRYDIDHVTSDGVEARRLAPLDIVQSEGPGFTVNDGFLEWETWQLRISVVPFEGLVLHEIAWREGETVRPVLYRAALAEMVVPYGSTMTNHWWKNAFDAGEIGLGKLLNSLTLGCDCLGEIVYLDADMIAENGQSWTIENAVCIHEEDFGILWKHFDLMSNTTEVRRSRRLVVSTIGTVGNYEYAFYWYFYLDGTIEFEVKMTGIVQTQAVAPGVTPGQAAMIAPQLAAPHHQHLFCFRLDFDVDGGPNTVVEQDVVALPPGEANPYLNAFDTVRTPLRTEAQAMRDIDPAASRVWYVENRESPNRLGGPSAYKLMPGASPTMLARPGSAIRDRATFATHNLWVTPYDRDEIHAAGDYPYQHPGHDGLPRWTAADRPIEDTDVVVWHTFGATHISRPEDWPVMPVERLGFTLKPSGFFDRNPALNLEPSDHCATD